MVHLSQIPNNDKVAAPLVDGLKKLTMAASSEEDRFTTSVYGSRFAAEDLPEHEMPDGEMPKEVCDSIEIQHVNVNMGLNEQG